MGDITNGFYALNEPPPPERFKLATNVERNGRRFVTAGRYALLEHEFSENRRFIFVPARRVNDVKSNAPNERNERGVRRTGYDVQFQHRRSNLVRSS